MRNAIQGNDLKKDEEEKFRIMIPNHSSVIASQPYFEFKPSLLDKANKHHTDGCLSSLKELAIK